MAWLLAALIMARDYHRPALGPRRLQHRALYVSALRPPRGVAGALHRPRGLGTGPLGFIGNVIWLVLAGWWLAILHLAHAAVLAVTIIGLPFAWAHIKLAAIALWPIGRMIVTVEEAASQN